MMENELSQNTPGHRILSEGEREVIAITKHRLNVVRGIMETFPQSRELSLALTKLDEAEMWATKAVTENGVRPEE